MVGGLPGNSFVFVEFEEGGGVLEVAALAFGAGGLDVTERVEAFLELAREPLGVQAEGGEGAMGVNDVDAFEKGGFKRGDAVESPGGVGEFLGEVGFGGGGGLVFLEEAAAMRVVRGSVFGGEDGGAAGEAVGEGVHGRTLFAGGGARTGGAIGSWGLGIRDRVCH
jgi:hypothetical protein